MQRLWRQRFLGILAGFAVLSLSAASLQAQDTTTAGQARMDTSSTNSTKLDSTMQDSTKSDTAKADTLNQNPPGYRGMDEDTSSATGDTSATGRTTSTYNGSGTSSGSVTEVRPPDAVDTTADTSRMGP